MKHLFTLLIAALLVACSEEPKKTVSPAPSPAPTARDMETRTAVGAYHRSKDAAAAVNIEQIRSAINAFHAANGRYPASVDEIRSVVGSDIDLGPYTYNPQNGSLTKETP